MRSKQPSHSLVQLVYKLLLRRIITATLCLSLILPIHGTNDTLISHGSRQEKKIALTFDDGPKPGVSAPLLRILDDYGIRATFFLTGKESLENSDLVFRISNSGHSLANHSYSHPNLTTLSEKEVTKQLKDTNKILSNISGKKTKYFRPPGGKYNQRITNLAKQEGLKTILWDVNAGDYTNRLATEHSPIAEQVIKQVRPGSIVLLHNGGIKTNKAVKKIIQTLEEKGYRFVTLDELLETP
jgi:peptidoglycan-N-acetylglucosamine deacetylase